MRPVFYALVLLALINPAAAAVRAKAPPPYYGSPYAFEGADAPPDGLPDEEGDAAPIYEESAADVRRLHAKAAHER
jgi:hypothetical protein